MLAHGKPVRAITPSRCAGVRHSPPRLTRKRIREVSFLIVNRQRQSGTFQSRGVVSFQNLFYVRPTATPEALDLHQLTAEQVLVSRDGQPIAWCAIADARGEIHGLGIALRAISALAQPATNSP